MIEQHAASAIIIRNDGRILIGKRSDSKETHTGKWETIGGKIDPGETSSECIRREVWEEIGVGVDSLDFYRHYDLQLTADLLVHTDVYTVQLADDPIANPDDFSVLRWVNLEELYHYDLIPEIRSRLIEYFEA